MKKLFFIIFSCTLAVSCKQTPLISTIVIQSDTTFVIPENPTAFENWLRIEFPDSLANDIYVETLQKNYLFPELQHPKRVDSRKKQSSYSLFTETFTVFKGKKNQAISKDYGVAITVKITGVKSAFKLRIEAASMNNVTGIGATGYTLRDL